jgi:hypothetical protein
MRWPPVGLRHAVLSSLHPLETAVVSRLALPTSVSSAPVPASVLLAVTRRRNSALVAALCEQARLAGGRCLLWALDAPVKGLENVTVGQGPGTRTELLNRLAAAADLAPDEYVVLADDDVELVVGDLATLLRVCDIARFAIAQPAHTRSSIAAFRFVVGQTRLIARSTTVIECGPLVVVSPEFRDRVLPMPDDFGMGWGLELVWHQARRDGERFGLVDAVRQRHHGAIAVDYPHPVEVERDRFIALRDAAGLANLPDLYQVLATWSRRQPHPPW